MKIGFTELLLVFIVALLVIGPDKLPLYARKLGIALKEFRHATNDMTKEIRESVVEPLEEAQKPIREAMAPLEEMEKEINGNIKGLGKSLDDLGRGKAVRKDSDKTEDIQDGEGAEKQADTETVDAEGPESTEAGVAEAAGPAEVAGAAEAAGPAGEAGAAEDVAGNGSPDSRETALSE